MPSFRPRLRFSLRTLFVLVTLLCVWLGYHIHWVNQRREAIRQFDLAVTNSPTPSRAPFGLWILGEKGEPWIFVKGDNKEIDKARLQELFPEARVVVPDWEGIEEMLQAEKP